MKKKDLLPHLVTLILAVLISSLVSVAASGNLFDSNEVVYDNTSSGMSSTNVKTAVDELYAAATDYSNISSRVSNLENYFDDDKLVKNMGIELNSSGRLTNYGGYIDFHYGGSTSDHTSRIIEDKSGSLNITNTGGNQILKLNGTEIAPPKLLSITASVGKEYSNASFYMGNAIFISYKLSGVTITNDQNITMATVASNAIPNQEIPCVAQIGNKVPAIAWIRSNSGQLVLNVSTAINNQDVRFICNYIK